MNGTNEDTQRKLAAALVRCAARVAVLESARVLRSAGHESAATMLTRMLPTLVVLTFEQVQTQTQTR